MKKVVSKDKKTNPRKDWITKFKKMVTNNDDKLIFPDIFEDEKLAEFKNCW